MSIVLVHEASSGENGFHPYQSLPPKPLGLPIEGSLVTLGECRNSGWNFPRPEEARDDASSGYPLR